MSGRSGGDVEHNHVGLALRSNSTGVAIPDGIYDLLANWGAVMVGVLA